MLASVFVSFAFGLRARSLGVISFPLFDLLLQFVVVLCFLFCIVYCAFWFICVVCFFLLWFIYICVSVLSFFSFFLSVTSVPWFVLV